MTIKELGECVRTATSRSSAGRFGSRCQQGIRPSLPYRIRQLQQSQMRAATTASTSSSSASTSTQADLNELEAFSSYSKSSPTTTTSFSDEDEGEIQTRIRSFNPTASARARKLQLPSSRYNYRPPKYYRGPLHPHQPPKASDPASREFQPGPFSLPRLQETYKSTFAPDLLTLSYQHFPPGYVAPTKAARLRSWEGDSPYFKNRPLRAPRGADVLGLVRKPITFRNIPALKGITVHSFVKQVSQEGSAHLHVASMALQSITGVRCQTHKSKKAVPGWGLKAGKTTALTATLKNEDMYHFLSKLVDLVMPRIREWKGIKGTSGDDNGNISFGFKPDVVAYFPEIEINYDAYPPKMIPGCHVTLHTTATNDKDARLLLSALGIPFYGKLVN